MTDDQPRPYREPGRTPIEQAAFTARASFSNLAAKYNFLLRDLALGEGREDRDLGFVREDAASQAVRVTEALIELRRLLAAADEDARRDLLTNPNEFGDDGLAEYLRAIEERARDREL